MTTAVLRRLRLLMLPLLLCAAIMIGDARPAHACTPAPGWTPPSLSQRYAQAAYVVHGRIHSTGSQGGHVLAAPTLVPEISAAEHFRLWHRFALSVRTSYGYYALVEVEGYYKGGGGPRLAIWGFGYGPDCMNTAHPGEEVIIFADGRAPFLDLRYQGPQTAVLDADAAVLAELAALTGKPPQPPDTSRRVMWLPVGLVAVILTPIGLRRVWRLMEGRHRLKSASRR